MNRTTRLANVVAIAVVLASLVAGCDRKSSWPEPGEQLPGWAYDAPYYYEPQADEELKAIDIGLEGQIPHYYSRENVVMLKRPDCSPAAQTPRLAVFYSDDHCVTWHKAGYFGIDQAFFSFVAPCEGTYAIRFAGAGIEPVRLCRDVPPQRVLHIDQSPPCVVVQVNPAKECYNVGDAVTVSWTVSDANIDPESKVTLYDIATPTTSRVVGSEFPLCGSVGVIIPASARECGARFAVEATDKAGNIGRGFSFLIMAPSGAQPIAPAVGEPAASALPQAAAPCCPENVDEADQPASTPPVQNADQPATGQPMSRSVTPPVTVPARTPLSSNTDRVPVVAPPSLPIAEPASVSADPVDRAVESAYRPRLYPTTQNE